MPKIQHDAAAAAKCNSTESKQNSCSCSKSCSVLSEELTDGWQTQLGAADLPEGETAGM
jgi:hypothetical protein